MPWEINYKLFAFLCQYHIDVPFLKLEFCLLGYQTAAMGVMNMMVKLNAKTHAGKQEK